MYGALFRHSNCSKACHEVAACDLMGKMQLAEPRSGPSVVYGVSEDLKAVKLQALANLEKSTSGWLNANPAFFANRTSKITQQPPNRTHTSPNFFSGSAIPQNQAILTC
jgi:hypothetical protein